MDSGNSGSLQSSSGDDEEYDSRAADSFSGFLTHPPLHQPAPPPPFDPLSNYMQLQNPNLFWPRSGADLGSEGYGNSTFMANFTPPTAASGDVPTVVQTADNRAQPLNQVARNPKKRSRASRRAPTTVLTTDTTNFRAMVQEFTGIPAPPFTSSSPFQRSRLDLFSTPSMRFADPAQPSSYLRRPFAQDVQSPPTQPPLPFLSSTAAAAAAAAQTSASNPSPAMNYHIPSPNSNLFKISNQNITSLLQTNTKFPFSSSILGSKIQDSFQIPAATDRPNMKMRSGFDDFSVSHGGGDVSATLSSLPNLVPSDQIQPRNEHDYDHDNDNTNSTNNNDRSWRNNNDEVNPDQPVRRLVDNGNYGTFTGTPRNSAGNVNFPASSSSAGQENTAVATRSEGVMESWICSSE